MASDPLAAPASKPPLPPPPPPLLASFAGLVGCRLDLQRLADMHEDAREAAREAVAGWVQRCSVAGREAEAEGREDEKEVVAPTSSEACGSGAGASGKRTLPEPMFSHQGVSVNPALVAARLPELLGKPGSPRAQGVVWNARLGQVLPAGSEYFNYVVVTLESLRKPRLTPSLKSSGLEIGPPAASKHERGSTLKADESGSRPGGIREALDIKLAAVRQSSMQRLSDGIERETVEPSECSLDRSLHANDSYESLMHSASRTNLPVDSSSSLFSQQVLAATAAATALPFQSQPCLDVAAGPADPAASAPTLGAAGAQAEAWGPVRALAQIYGPRVQRPPMRHRRPHNVMRFDQALFTLGAAGMPPILSPSHMPRTSWDLADGFPGTARSAAFNAASGSAFGGCGGGSGGLPLLGTLSPQQPGTFGLYPRLPALAREPTQRVLLDSGWRGMSSVHSTR